MGQDSGEKEGRGNRGEMEKVRRDFFSTTLCFVKYSGGWFILFLFFTLHSNAWWKKNPSLKSCYKITPSFSNQHSHRS